MNEAAINALVAAAMNGTRQIVGMLADKEGGRCAGGVVAEAQGVQLGRLYDPEQSVALRHVVGTFRNGTMTCPHDCGRVEHPHGELGPTEWRIMVHMNNVHRDDFLTIARKLGENA